MSPRQLIWSIVTLIAFTVVFGALIWYPVLAAAALVALVFTAGRAGAFRRLKQEFRRFLDYQLYHSLS